ncbi:ADP-ribosylglycohydrolase family protein [Moorena sp. SIO4G3]|uniref:ADP-ribosylglycohydrolase family protein n=1 Tax=Moorena sp. SIO4G3 TaxID=2607821 RepID=UPI00142B25D4|nr:ADP-ribosylglycohydrolase family protein [Moorena sp. SIO4G3]NEO80555.1 ADP-ribosylglycohydrolase family protein [Moorena sp. SIO4G3]
MIHSSFVLQRKTCSRLHALAMALFPQDDPEFLLAEIIRQGYDTDTVAAICGGILGARFGTNWIPLERLQERERLENYAAALVDFYVPVEHIETFLAREAELSQQEANYQKKVMA